MLESVGQGAFEVVEAGDFVEALAVVREHTVDVGLVDLNMPGMDGFSGIEALRRSLPKARLVVISASEDPRDVRRALDSGAQGYIAKSSPSSTMIEGIRAVMDGATYLSPHLKVAEGEVADDKGDLDRLRAALTPRQRDVLAMLRQGKSNKEIARDLDLAEITVKLHVTAILRALGVENRTQAAILAARLGV